MYCLHNVGPAGMRYQKFGDAEKRFSGPSLVVYSRSVSQSDLASCQRQCQSSTPNSGDDGRPVFDFESSGFWLRGVPGMDHRGAAHRSYSALPMEIALGSFGGHMTVARPVDPHR